MSDPRAGLILAAEDVTGAAFASANRNLVALEGNARRASTGGSSGFRNFTSSVMAARGALASLGIVLSGRALFSWMIRAVEATTAIGEQRQAVLGARQAFVDLKAVSDQLGENLAVRLTPAVTALAEAMNEFRRSRDPTTLDIFNAKLETTKQIVTDLTAEIEKQERLKGKKFLGIFSASLPESSIEDMKRRLAQAQETQRVLNAGSPDDTPLEFIDEKAIGQQRMAVDEIGLMLERQRQKEREAARAAHDAEQQDVIDALEAFHNARMEREREEGEQADRRRELLERQVDDLKLHLLTEIEFEAETYARRQEMLDQSLREKLLSEQEHARLSTELERQTSQKIADIRKQEEQRDRQLRLAKLGGYASLAAGIAAITSVGAEDSKKKFETHKKIATAAAIVDTYAAVAYALRNPPGPPFSIPQAVAAGLFGFAQVKAIQSTTWSGAGGGGFGAAGGGGGEVASAPTINDRTAGLLSGDGSGGRGAPQINITITGIVGRIDGETAREIGRSIGNEINNHDFEFMARSSRQVLTIRGEGVQDETS